MDLAYSNAHETFRREVAVFLQANAHLAPRAGNRADALSWQKLLIEHPKQLP